MTDLTEQWKKGELPSGWYYVELKEGTFVDGKKSIILDYLFEFTNDFQRHPYLVEQVLAPVPSYEEWKALNGNMDSVMQTNQALCKKLAELKELLKECELWFTGIVGNMNDKNVGEHNRNLPIGNFEHMFKVFLQKINEELK